MSLGPRLTYAVAPPNRATPPERRRAIAAAQSARISELPIDAVLVYDVQDEAARNRSPRPFPFLPKVDPLTYALGELEVGRLPLVVYCAVGGHSEEGFCDWLNRLRARDGLAVLVGSPSRQVSTSLTLSRAQALRREAAPGLPIGGVVIPERHRTPYSEVARLWAKVREGCSFFVSQTLWSVSTTERLLVDLRRHAEAESVAVPTILFTLSPCGSERTLEFLEWLGVEVPASVKQDLLSAKDMLHRSIELATEAYARVRTLAALQGLSVGCNVESVSTRPAEVEASVELVHRIHRLELGFGGITPSAAPADQGSLPLPRAVPLPPTLQVSGEFAEGGDRVFQRGFRFPTPHR